MRVGDIVMYVSKNGDGIESPAVILRTKASTDLAIIERWSLTSPDGTLSGKERPAALVAELPEKSVDLLVFGLGGDYREYCIPYDLTMGAGTWHYLGESYVP